MTVFEESANVNPEEINQPTEEEQRSYYESLVGEGKKFKDAEALAYGKQQSDAHIERLERENKERDMELEVLRKQLSQPKAPAPQEQPTDDKPKDEGKGIAESVKAEVEALRKQEKAANNVDTVVLKLQEELGSQEAVVKYIATKAKELGVGAEWLKNIAAQSPDAFYNVVGLKSNSAETPAGGASPYGKGVKTPPQPQEIEKQKTANYYNELRRSDRQKWNSPAVQTEIYNLRMEGKL